MDSNPYAGVDRDLARRMSAAFCLIVAVLALAVLPLTPPTAAIGDIGWMVAGLNGLVALGAAALLLSRPRVPYTLLLATGYLAVGQIALAQWLAGGLDAPYLQLFVLPALQVAAVHPLRRVVPFFAVLVTAAAAPLLYEGWRSTTAAAFLLGVRCGRGRRRSRTG